MSAWLIWLIIAGLLAAAETASTTLVFVMFSGGAAAAAAAAGLGAPVAIQAVVAVVVSVALLGAVRPVVRRHMVDTPLTRTGSEALVGKEAVVLSAVDAYDGRVRLNGAEWTARTAKPAVVLPPGTVVRVVRIDGATAVVELDEHYGYAAETAVR